MTGERPLRSLCAALLFLLPACTDAPLDAPPGEPPPSSLTGTAWFPLPPGEEPIPCAEDDSDPVCDDNDVCTIDACLFGLCRHGPTWVEGCCNDDSDCDDEAPCSVDFCSEENVCVYEATDAPDCCVAHGDCGPGGPHDDLDPSTFDYCLNSKCDHQPDPLYCEEGDEWGGPDDGNPCTTMVCVGDSFVAKWAYGCCMVDWDCDDDNLVTIDSCIEGECSYTLMASHCFNDYTCMDDNPCNIDACVNNQCRYWADPILEYCCTSDDMCDDGSYCTTDYCNTDTNTCVITLTPLDPPCCLDDLECDDGNPFTKDICSSEQQCTYEPSCLCLEEFGNCNDSNPCTVDSCESCMCKFTWIDGCCTEDSQCTSEYACMQSHCNQASHACVNLELYNCCNTDDHCTTGGAWDDGNDCTWDMCVAGTCRHVTPEDGC